MNNIFITEKIDRYPHNGRGVANIGPLPCGTDFTPDDAAGDILPGVSGFTLLAYLLRRFGAPTGPGDTFKSLPNWILTTPMQDVFLRVSPYLPDGGYSFGVWMPSEVYGELISSETADVDVIHAAIKHAAQDLMRIVRVRDVMIDAYGVIPFDEWPDIEDETIEDCFAGYSDDPLGTATLRARLAEVEAERDEATARAERAEALVREAYIEGWRDGDASLGPVEWAVDAEVGEAGMSKIEWQKKESGYWEARLCGGLYMWISTGNWIDEGGGIGEWQYGLYTINADGVEYDISEHDDIYARKDDPRPAQIAVIAKAIDHYGSMISSLGTEQAALRGGGDE